MMGTSNAPTPDGLSLPRPSSGREPWLSAATLVVLARKELRDAVRNKWFIAYAAGFTVMALGVSYLAQVGTGYSGFAGFGPTAASMINLVLLLVPLMALTLGASSVALERDRGMLAYVLAQPVNRIEVILAKYVGLAIGLLGSLALGFGAAGLVIARQAETQQLGLFLRLVFFSGLLALAMLAVGMMLATFIRRSTTATGTALLVWLVLLLLGDLGLMGSAVVFRLQSPELFLIAVVNPNECFRLAVIGGFDPSLDVLGPSGLYASNTFGGKLSAVLVTILCIWVFVPLLLSVLRFTRRPL
jgi:Cu-processing system permease protein